MSLKRVKGNFEFDKNLAGYQKFKKDAPKVIANNSKNHFLEGFRKGGGQTDDSKGGWERRKPRATRDSGRAILVYTGALRRSVKVLVAKFGEIIIGTTGIPYARRHNEGLDMPKREYIGDSKELTDNNLKLVTRLMNKVMKI